MRNEPRDKEERAQEALNPHRREDQERAAATIVSQLARRGVRAVGDENGDQLADLLTAVERFEAAVVAAGGDLMNNQPTSNDPEEPRFVIALRSDDESADAYVARLRAAADALGPR
jgi:hypothetical protein